MSLWNDKFVEYANEHDVILETVGRTIREDKIINGVVDAEFYADSEVNRVSGEHIMEIRDRRADTVESLVDLAKVEALLEFCKVLGINPGVGLFPTEEDGWPIMSSGKLEGPSIGGDAENEDAGSIQILYSYDEPTDYAYVASYVDWGNDVINLVEEYIDVADLNTEIADQLSHGLDILVEDGALGGAPDMSHEAYQEAMDRIAAIREGSVDFY